MNDRNQVRRRSPYARARRNLLRDAPNGITNGIILSVWVGVIKGASDRPPRAR